MQGALASRRRVRLALVAFPAVLFACSVYAQTLIGAVVRAGCDPEQELLVVDTLSGYRALGFCASALGDMDLDGVPDFDVRGATSTSPTSSSTIVVSGASRAVMHQSYGVGSKQDDGLRLRFCH